MIGKYYYYIVLHPNEIKDHNWVSGNDAKSFPYYERLNEILGTRATFTSPVVVESGEPDEQPNGGAVTDSSFPSVDMSPGPATLPEGMLFDLFFCASTITLFFVVQKTNPPLYQMAKAGLQCWNLPPYQFLS